MLNILTTAFAVHCRNAVVNNAHNEDSLKKEVFGLAKCICQLLIGWASSQSNAPETKTKYQNKKVPQMLTVVKKIYSQIGLDNEQTTATVILMMNSFMQVLKQLDTAKNKGEFAAAVSLLQCFISTYENTLTTDIGVNTWRETMLELYAKRTLGGGKFAPAAEIHLSSAFLNTLTQEEFDQTLLSTIGLKLRANPEAIMETANTMITIVTDKSKQQHFISMSAHLEGDSKLLSASIRQLRSSKIPMRECAISLLSNLALSSPDLVTLPIVVNVLSEGLAGGKSGTSFNTPDQREVAYQTLTNISESIRSMIKRNETIHQESLEDCISSTLEAIATAQNKEAAANVSTQDAGIRALLSLLTLSFSMNYKTEKGCTEALAYLSKPVIDTTGKSSSTASSGSPFRYRIGSLLTIVEDDFIKSFTTEFFKANAKFEKGLETIIEVSMKKFQTSGTVPQIDGLLAVYLLLLQCSLKSSMSMSPSLVKILSGDSKNSFIYGASMLDCTSKDPIVGKLLPRSIALFCKLVSKDEGNPEKATIFGKMFSVTKEQVNEISMTTTANSAKSALAACIANLHPSSYETYSSTSGLSYLQASIKTILTYTPDTNLTANSIVDALFSKIHNISTDLESAYKKLNATREARESEGTSFDSVRGKLSSFNHRGYDSCAIRSVVSELLADYVSDGALGRLFVLLHLGSSYKKDQGKQRKGLMNNVAKIIQRQKPDPQMIANFIASCATKPENDGGSLVIGLSIYESTLSLIMTLGSMGGNFDPEFDDPEDEELSAFACARSICVDHLAKILAEKLARSTKAVQALSLDDIDLYRSPEGILFDSGSGGEKISESGNAEKKRPVKNRKGKGDFGAGLEDEEWERQVKKELAEKKKKEGTSAQTTLSVEEKTLLATQTQKRNELSQIITVDFHRSLSAVKSLSKSDIEIGNACLPLLSDCVIPSVISISPAFQNLPGLQSESFEVLRILSTCVFEIEEQFAHDLARAIAISYRTKETTSKSNVPVYEKEEDKDIFESMSISALPSPCPTAATIISEIEETNECLSGPSFAFVFPIIRAALTGPRTSPGCEFALAILNRHALMIAGESADPFVAPLRRDMALTVLELLCHDRSQTFSDPTPTEALCACYILPERETTQGSLLSPGELAPLLGERGSLSGKNCRIGSMIALGAIAMEQPILIKNNPLTENRIWINCFDEDKDVRKAARQTWRYAHGVSGEENEDSDICAPSQMYSIPLLPLLDHENPSIARSAANAYAHAMGKHPGSIEKNIIRICNAYIEAYPSTFDEEKVASFPLPPKPKKQPIVKKIVKKPIKSSALKIGVPTTRKSTKPSIVMPKPKARQIDKAQLEGQFLSESSKSDPGKDNPKKIAIRLGVLRVITALTDSSANISLELSILKSLVSFLMAYGLADVDDVRSNARNAARDVVSKFGDSEDALSFLLPLFEAVLSTGKADESFLEGLSTEKVLRNTMASDRRKEGAVVCLGSTAIHLKGEENLDKIDTTIDMLIATLRTPSEEVQSSVAMCLSKLMKKGRTPERIGSILTKLMTDCLNGDSLAVRRGSAYGISAVVKGSGISSLKKFDIIKQLDEGCKTGTSSAKEGALFTIELLSDRLGLLFEPYVIVLLPALLKAFSDSSDHVRSAASNTVGLIMSKLSAHGVKLVMPAVLTAFDEPAWRTKQASIHMLGSMSHCAPKQLANCLPKVVPQLTEAFSDTHPKVKASAEDALKEICKVIKNPEISSISPVLLKALTDPANETITALEALIETEFLHAIDSPSLALLVPVLHRGLRDRSAKTKRYGALISGNICTMINDPRDFIPYLPTLLPDLKAVLLDPIPDVRSTASKALGSLTRGLGEDSLPDLRPWLIETLKGEDGSAVERSGAAQGLTEVLIAGGAALVEEVMREEILPLKSHPKASTREGVLWVLTFMPSSLGHAFTPLIDLSLPALLTGLSDDNEQIREVALRAGRVLIRSHGKAHVYKILPSLEDGLIDDDWRIRVSSLTLLGDLLSLIGGTKVVKGDSETQVSSFFFLVLCRVVVQENH